MIRGYEKNLELQLEALGLLQFEYAFPLDISQILALSCVEDQVVVSEGEVKYDLCVLGKGKPQLLLPDLPFRQPRHQLPLLPLPHTCSMNSRSSW